MFHIRSGTKVEYFGLHVEEAYEFYDIQDAFNFLVKRVRHTHEEDIRGYDVDSALEFLQSCTAKPYPFNNFRRAMAIENPTQRVMELRAAPEAIRKQFQNRKISE